MACIPRRLFVPRARTRLPASSWRAVSGHVAVPRRRHRCRRTSGASLPPLIDPKGAAMPSARRTRGGTAADRDWDSDQCTFSSALPSPLSLMSAVRMRRRGHCRSQQKNLHPNATRARNGSDVTSAAKGGYFGDVTMWATRRAKADLFSRLHPMNSRSHAN